MENKSIGDILKEIEVLCKVMEVTLRVGLGYVEQDTVLILALKRMRELIRELYKND